MDTTAIALIAWIGGTLLLSMAGYMGAAFLVGLLGWIVMFIPAIANQSDRNKYPKMYDNSYNKREQ